MDAPDMMAQAEERIVAIGVKLKKGVKQFMRAYVHQYGITYNEMELLTFLSHSPHDTAKEFCKKKGYTKSLTSKMIDDLIKNGYLESKQDERDRRVFHLSLKPKAEQILQDLNQIREKLKDILLAGITQEEIDQVLYILEKMASNLHEKTKTHTQEEHV